MSSQIYKTQPFLNLMKRMYIHISGFTCTHSFSHESTEFYACDPWSPMVDLQDQLFTENMLNADLT